MSGTAIASVDTAVDNDRKRKAAAEPAAHQRRARHRSRGRSPSRRFGRGKSVALLTCGHNKLNVKHPRSFGKDLTAFVDELEYAIEVKSQADVCLDLTFQFMDMHDPSEDKSLRGHYGEHAHIMQTMIQHKQTRPKFKRHLARMKLYVKDLSTCIPTKSN